MQTTRCKFFVAGLTLLPGKDAGIRIELTAVARGDRNAGWAKATPCGTMSMTVNNPEAVRAWEEFMQAARSTGKSPELFIDLRPSEDGWPGDHHAFRLSEVAEGDYGHGTCGECGLAKDAPLWVYDDVLRKSVESGLAHPEG